MLYFVWADKRDKMCFIFHKIGAVWKIKKFICYAQHIPEGNTYIAHTSITLNSYMNVNVHMHALSSMSTMICFFIQFNFSSLVKYFSKAQSHIINLMITSTPVS